VGNINFDGIGFEKDLWKNLWKICPEFVENFTLALKIVFHQNRRAIDRTSFSTSFPQVILSEK
jgi:hypothetical protein